MSWGSSFQFLGFWLQLWVYGGLSQPQNEPRLPLTMQGALFEHMKPLRIFPLPSLLWRRLSDYIVPIRSICFLIDMRL